MTYTEDQLIEQSVINLFSNIGWQTLDCYCEVFRKAKIMQASHIGAAWERLNDKR